MNGGVLLDRETGRPEGEPACASAFDDDALSVISNIPTVEQFEASGRTMRIRGETHLADPIDRARLERFPKAVRRTMRIPDLPDKLPASVRRYLELAEQERKLGAGLKTGALVAGMTQSWSGHIQPSNVIVADQTAIVGTTEALLYPYGFALIPGGWWAVGSTIKLSVAGKITSAASTPGNLTVTARYGNTTAGTSLAASAALALQTSQTNITWLFEGYVVCRTANATGTTGTLMVIGVFSAGTGTTLFTTGPQASVPASAPVTAAPDLSVANALLLDGTLGSASDSMSVQLLAPLAIC